MNKSLREQLIEKGFTKSQKPTNEKKQQRKKEQGRKKQSALSQRELEELMGMRRDTFKRVNGSVRRK